MTWPTCPECGSSLHVIGTQPDGRILYRCLGHCRVPEPTHVDRYTPYANPPHHFDYYSHAQAEHLLLGYRVDPIPSGTMDPEQRLWILELGCIAFLASPEETDYLVVQSGTDWCHGIQLLFHDGVVLVEVSPRHWDPCARCRNQPLPPAALDELHRLGFHGGGPGTNLGLDGLWPNPAVLARFIERLFVVAYQEPPDFAVGLRFRHGDIAEAFVSSIAVGPLPQ
jgi:hypothetical protein